MDEAALKKLYDTLKVDKPTEGFSTLSSDAKRVYQRIAKARSRERQKQLSACGIPDDIDDNVRMALSDAAMMILATGGPGAEQIRSVLIKVFPHKPGLGMTLSSNAKAGRIKPKLLKL